MTYEVKDGTGDAWLVGARRKGAREAGEKRGGGKWDFLSIEPIRVDGKLNEAGYEVESEHWQRGDAFCLECVLGRPHALFCLQYGLSVLRRFTVWPRR